MPVEDRSIIESIETLLLQIKQQTRAISSEEVLIHAREGLVGAIADVDEALNARRPLLSLPTELLQKVMTFIPTVGPPPDQKRYRLPWHIGVYDTAMLIPVSQVCRRLRDVALGCPSLWTGIVRGPRSLSRFLAQRSQGLPLKAFLRNRVPWRSGEVDLPDDYDIADVAKDARTRIRELCVVRLVIETDLEALFSAPLPMLESLSVHFGPGHCWTADYSYHNAVHLPKEHAPRLRLLAIHGCRVASLDLLSSLTHLALCNIHEGRVHDTITTILSACHSLQSLHIEDILDFEYAVANQGPIEDYRLPTPSPLPASACRSLRRLVLSHMYGAVASLVLSLMLAEQPRLAVQLHRVWMDVKPTYPRHRLFDSFAEVVIGRYPQLEPLNSVWTPPSSSVVWGITTSGPQRTVRMTRETLDGAIDMPLSHQWDAETLAGVRKLWLADVSPAPSDGESTLPPSDAAILRALIRDMPALETVHLVNQFQTSWTRAPPSLGLLPDARRDDPFAPRPSTVRIVYGYGKHVLHRWPLRPGWIPAIPPLDLTCILDELASGAYSYLRHLVIEVPYPVQVDPVDVERLRAHVETVQVRVVDETPTIALPTYCDEPAGWPDDAPWPYRLW